MLLVRKASGAGTNADRRDDLVAGFRECVVCVRLAGMRRAAWAWSGGIALATGLALAVSGCAGQLTEQQRLWLARGQESYAREDYAHAIDWLTRFLAEVQEGPEVGQALYVRGLSNAQAGRRTQAYSDLRRCAALGSNVDTGWRVHVVLGTLHFEDHQWDRAAEHWRAAAECMPAAPPKDTVLYRLGLCYERTGRWEAARQRYQEIADGFAGGQYADAARRRLLLKADHFAVQCGAFREEKNAENLRSSLRSKGLSPYIRRELRGRTPLHIVLIGRYETYEEAQRQLAAVRELVPDAILWP